MWWILCLVPSVFLLINYAVQKTSGKSWKIPPGPLEYPIIGNLLEVGRLVKRRKFHWAAWEELRKTYGDVFRIKLGVTEPLVVVSGRKAVMDFLGRREFDGRPDTYEIRLRSFGKKRGIVLNDGQDWADLKRFLLKVLRDFGYSKQTMEELLQEDAEMLCNIIKDKMLEKEVDVHDFCEIAAIAVVSGLWTLVAGERCDPRKKESEEMLEILRILQDSFRNGSTAGALWVHIPFLRILMPKLSGFAAQQERIDRMSNFFQKIVDKHVKTRQAGVRRDLIDAYLEEIELKKDEQQTAFDGLQLVVLLKDVFSAGVETTSNTMGFGIVFLAKWQEIQKKCHEELDRVVGRDGRAHLGLKNSLPYLNATIAEILRHANVSSTTIAHRALDDGAVLGHDIRKNWSIIGDLRSVHMDPEHWKEPEKFNPERFLNSNGDYVDDPWLMPFGFGRRKCLGENLARSSLFLFFAYLLQNFKFDLAASETLPCLLGINGFTISPPHAKILIVSR